MLCKCRTNAGYRTRPAGTLDYSGVGELVQLAASRLNGGARPLGTAGAEFRWQTELAQTSETLPDVEQLLKRKTAVVLFAYLVLQIIRIGAQLLFRMEVRGRRFSIVSNRRI